MQRIDKSTVLANEYKLWEENLEANQTKHPPYNSSKHKYYHDIVANLFYCQKGLCAYSEAFLCPATFYQPENWQQGKYVGKAEFLGQLEHFDPELKANKAWLWDNLFMVHSDINTKQKGSKPVDAILKPDREGYNPFELLRYDEQEHKFYPNIEKVTDEATQQRIISMILVLGINFPPFIDLRRELLNKIKTGIEFGNETWQNARVSQFPTAFEMLKKKYTQH